MSNPPITSLQNARVKEAIKLRDRRQRNKQQRFVIDGAREVDRALAAGVDLVEIFLCEELCHSPESQSVLQRLAVRTGSAASGCAVWPVTPQVMAKLAFGDRAEGVVAVAHARSRRLSELVLPENPLVAVLAGIEKPGNLGAILRSADGAGVDAVLVVDGGTDLENPNAIRASLGTIFQVPSAVASADEVLDWLRGRGFRIFAARLDAQLDHTQADLRGPTALVLGSEAAGLDSRWTAADVTPIRLPMRGIADSLNVSATAAVLFYEALRQRGR